MHVCAQHNFSVFAILHTNEETAPPTEDKAFHLSYAVNRIPYEHTYWLNWCSQFLIESLRCVKWTIKAKALRMHLISPLLGCFFSSLPISFDLGCMYACHDMHVEVRTDCRSRLFHHRDLRDATRVISHFFRGKCLYLPLSPLKVLNKHSRTGLI